MYTAKTLKFYLKTQWINSFENSVLWVFGHGYTKN